MLIIRQIYNYTLLIIHYLAIKNKIQKKLPTFKEGWQSVVNSLFNRLKFLIFFFRSETFCPVFQ
jgi:hypothetical protein